MPAPISVISMMSYMDASRVASEFLKF